MNKDFKVTDSTSSYTDAALEKRTCTTVLNKITKDMLHNPFHILIFQCQRLGFRLSTLNTNIKFKIMDFDLYRSLSKVRSGQQHLLI